MTLEALRALVRWHAAAAWLATAALVAIGVMHLRGRRPRLVAWLGGLGAALTVAAALSGAMLDEGYRARLRQHLFLESASLGWLFERKLHLAFGALVLALAGASTLAASASSDAGELGPLYARGLRRAATVAWVTAALLALIASGASWLVSQRITF
jgi:hypothetical protein